MARPGIICSLPPDEFLPVARELSEAGFDVLHAATPDEAAAILDRRRDIGVGIIDGENDFDTSLELFSLIHGNGREVPTLMVVCQRAFERLSSNAMGADSTEYFTRPYVAEALRWRVEAMLIRSQTFDDGSGPILAGDLPARRPRQAGPGRGRLQPQGRRRQDDHRDQPRGGPPDHARPARAAHRRRHRRAATSPPRSGWSTSSPSPTPSRTRRPCPAA